MDWKDGYSASAIECAAGGALDWLEGNSDGYPRSWAQETANNDRRGYVMYDDYDFEAPPIAGYEALEREGRATRLEAVDRSGEERIHFRIVKLQQT